MIEEDSGITEVIEREFGKLIKAQLTVNQHLEKIVDDHDKRLRNLERYSIGLIGAYSFLMKGIYLWNCVGKKMSGRKLVGIIDE